MKVGIVVNPISGKPEPILYYINKALNQKGIEWDLYITKKAGDTERYTEVLKGRVDIVAVYGGDGTVMSAAQQLMHSDTPLAIVPGGSANLLSKELSIPQDSLKALMLITARKKKFKALDMGLLNDDRKFILRIGLGFAADKVKKADRQLKERFGMLAYSIAGVQAFKAAREITYHIDVDGVEEEVTGYSCAIFNSSNMGVGNLRLSDAIDPSDGYMNLVVFKTRNFARLLEQRFINKGGLDDFERSISHFRGKKFIISTDEISDIQVDGELLSGSMLTVEVIPKAVKILVP